MIEVCFKQISFEKKIFNKYMSLQTKKLIEKSLVSLFVIGIIEKKRGNYVL